MRAFHYVTRVWIILVGVYIVFVIPPIPPEPECWACGRVLLRGIGFMSIVLGAIDIARSIIAQSGRNASTVG